MKKGNGKDEGFYINGQMQKNKRNGLRKYRGNQYTSRPRLSDGCMCTAYFVKVWV